MMCMTGKHDVKINVGFSIFKESMMCMTGKHDVKINVSSSILMSISPDAPHAFTNSVCYRLCTLHALA